ncbi:protein LNK1 isoform X1 [Cryptomeria japonica]|uniref:protein LNK1 isoform X1 n=2 Tax=Cryptomeria japonica TaxID=3369 RepID=UPI0027DA377B|nr:protein LNK1 isoform X1 [Cryptomeria japonica]XP_057844826.2 protein LNK1 isoform X1 [Cryptomeria japonica]
MSGWSIDEMDDMFWDEFNQTKDHIVPDPSGAKESTWTGSGKQWKKLQCQNSNMLAKSAEQKMVGVNNVFEGKVSDLSCSDKKGELSSQPINVDTWVILHDEDLATNAYDPMCDDLSMGIDSQKQGVNGGYCKDLKSVNGDLILGYSKEDPLLSSRDADAVTNSSHFLLSDISPTEGDLDIFEGDHRSETSNSILEYDWENMGNFEEVERLFRNSESTLSEAMDNSSDELIWHTASFVSTNHSDPRSMYQGMNSSNPEMTNMGRLQHTEPKVKMECVPCDSSSSLVFNQKDDSDVERAPHNDQTSGHYIPLKKPSMSHMLASRGNTENVSGTLFEEQKSKGGGISEEAIRSQSPCQNEQTCTTYQYTNKVNSNLMQTKDQIKFADDDMALNSQKVPYIHSGYGYPLHCLLTMPSSSPGPHGRQPQPYFAAYQLAEGTSKEHQALKQHFDMISAPPIMTPQDKIEKLRWCQQMQDKLAIDHKQQINSMESSLLHKHPQKLQYQHEDVKPQEVVDRISETSTGELDQQDNTSADCGSAFDNEDSSMEAAMLHQLQTSVMELDIGTRLNIRDALYRLARNAVQRHNVNDTKNNSVTRGEDIETCLQETSCIQADRCAGISNFETETNAIDRMVAHLLFHRSPVASGEGSFTVTEAPSDVMSSVNSETLPATSSLCLWDPSAPPLGMMQTTIPVQAVTPIQDTCMGVSNQCIVNMQGSSSLTRSCNAASLHFHSQICDPLVSGDLHNTANGSLSKHQGGSQNNNHASDAKCNLLTQKCAVLENGKGFESFDLHGMKKIEVSKPNDGNYAERDSSENMDIDTCNMSADVLVAEESSKVGVNKENNSYMEIENMEHVVQPISPPARIMLVH